MSGSVRGVRSNLHPYRDRTNQTVGLKCAMNSRLNCNRADPVGILLYAHYGRSVVNLFLELFSKRPEFVISTVDFVPDGLPQRIPVIAEIP